MPPVPATAEVSPIELDEISKLKVEVLFSKGSELARTHKLNKVMASWLFIALATCYCDLAIYCQSRRGYCELAIYCLSSTSYCEMAILLPELDELLRDGHFIARARLVIARWPLYCQIGEVVVSWLISIRQGERAGYCFSSKR
jgi:hypothetical protein